MRFVTVLSVLLLLGISTGVALADKYDTNEKDWSYGPMTPRATYPETEPNDTCPGQATVCGDVINPAALNFAGDQDWYYLSLTAGTLLTVGTDAINAGENTDTYLELYAACGGGIVAQDDDGGPGFYSLISNYNVPATGTYYIKCRGYSTSTTGPYKLFTICTVPTPPDPNDTCNSDYYISRCNEGVLEGNLQYDNNNYDPLSGGCASGYPEVGKDVAYRMDLQAGDHVSMTYIQYAFDTAFYIITDCNDPAGSCVVGADDTFTGEPEVIEWDAGTGTYWLILDAYGTGAGGAWSLSYTITCPAPRGACCINGECTITDQEGCNGEYQGNGTDCDPNPCPPPPNPTEEISWGQIKASYR